MSQHSQRIPRHIKVAICHLHSVTARNRDCFPVRCTGIHNDSVYCHIMAVLIYFGYVRCILQGDLFDFHILAAFHADQSWCIIGYISFDMPFLQLLFHACPHSDATAIDNAFSTDTDILLLVCVNNRITSPNPFKIINGGNCNQDGSSSIRIVTFDLSSIEPVR